MTPLYQNKDIHIFVVDDNSKNIQIIGQILLRQDYNVSFASGGAEAIEILTKQSNFDLILLDILMPEVDGFEVCDAIKKNELTKDIPIIFLTAKSDKESIVKGFQKGARDYVVKPFNEDELILRVKTQIELNKQRERLENINRYLEEEVQEKTGEIRDANKKLALLENAKNEFLTLISHELRTPLNIINGFTEILQDALQDTQHIEELKSLKDSSDRLISLAETALLITEIRLGKYTLDYEKVDLSEVCNNAAMEVKKYIANKDFSYEVQAVAGGNFIKGDFGLIQNIVTMITENSIIEGGENPIITYGIKKDKQNIVLEITDNGPGFSDSDMAKLFETFSKAGPNLNHDGFGLSLAAVKLVMEIHSGKVAVKNLPEGGASVSLHFKSA